MCTFVQRNVTVIAARGAALREWARLVGKAIETGSFGQIKLTRFEGVVGHRFALLDLWAGTGTGTLLKALARDQYALLRQYVPWRFVGSPTVEMVGRRVRVEVPLPEYLTVPVASAVDFAGALAPGEWVVGIDGAGEAVTARLSGGQIGVGGAVPHVLVGGVTRSGKTVALRNAVWQLSRHPVSFVLFDGKWGHSLRAVEHLPGVLGPTITQEDMSVARGAMAWVVAEVGARYKNENDVPLIVVIDEMQEFVRDPVLARDLEQIAAQGAGAHVHIVAATQYPNAREFSPTLLRNLAGRVAFRVADHHASRAIVGPGVRADRLLGGGDAYVAGAIPTTRIQGLYISEDALASASDTFAYDMPKWPVLNEPQEAVRRGRQQRQWQPDEMAAAIEVVSDGGGRPSLKRAFAERGLQVPGSAQCDRLLAQARGVLDALRGQGYDITSAVDVSVVPACLEL